MPAKKREGRILTREEKGNDYYNSYTLLYNLSSSSFSFIFMTKPGHGS